MKRIIAILLTIVVLFAFSGCAEKPQDTPKVGNTNEGGLEENASLVIWSNSDERIEFLEFVGQKFEQEYGIPVKVELVVDFFNRMVQDSPSNLGPDIVEAPHDHLGNLIVAGLVQPSSHEVDKFRSDFIESAANCLIFEDQAYGYPLSVNTYALIYNKALVEAPETFQELIDFAKTYNVPEENKYALMWQVGSPYYANSFLAGYGAYIFGNNGTDQNDIGLNTEDAIEGAKFYKSLKEILDIKSADASGQIIDGLFTNGKLAYTFSGQWTVTAYEKAGMDVGVAPIPKLPNGNVPSSFLGVHALYLSAYSKYPNAAKLFSEMANSEEMMMKRFEITGEIPALKTSIDSEAIKSDPIASAFLEQAQHSTPMPFIPQMGAVWDPYNRAMQNIWDNDMDEKAAMDDCVELIKSLIEMNK